VSGARAAASPDDACSRGDPDGGVLGELLGAAVLAAPEFAGFAGFAEIGIHTKGRGGALQNGETL